MVGRYNQTKIRLNSLMTIKYLGKPAVAQLLVFLLLFFIVLLFVTVAQLVFLLLFIVLLFVTVVIFVMGSFSYQTLFQS